MRLWPALDVIVRREGDGPLDVAESLAVLLDDLDARAVDAAEEGGPWRVFFADTPARDAARDHLVSALGERCDIEPIDVEDEGWVLKVQDALQAITVGRITVAPPWDIPADAQRLESSTGVASIVIVIEPSMGFGTGHHQSTRVCLRALQSLVLDSARVIDAGTGSGVLALAAHRLGATDVVAFDNDADSVAAAHGNLRLNSAERCVAVSQASLGDQTFTAADVVVANLTAWLLRRHAEDLAALVRSDGSLVLGGLTSNQVTWVTDAFSTWSVADRFDEDDWVALILRRSS